MMLQKVKYHFNLIEIALALAVLAIGMSSALLLFVAGANTNRQSQEENFFSEACTEITAELQTMVLSSSALPKNDDGTWEFADSKNDPTGVTDIETGTEIFKQIGTEYLYRKFGPAGEVVFSALVVVRKDISDPNKSGMGEEYFLDNGEMKQLKDIETTGTGTGESSDPSVKNTETVTKKIILPLAVTVGYPADISWEKQEKKTFRIEIYNEKFGLKTSP